MSREKPAATSPSSPSDEMPTVTSPRQPISASRCAAAAVGGRAGRPLLGRPRDPGDPRGPVPDDGRGEAQTVGGHPRQEARARWRARRRRRRAAPAPPASGPTQRSPAAATAAARRAFPASAGGTGSTAADAAAPGGLDDPADGQIGLGGRRGPEQHRVVGHPHVPGTSFRLGVHGHRLEPEAGTGRHDRARGRSPARDEHALDPELRHGRLLLHSPPDGAAGCPRERLAGQLGGSADAAHIPCTASSPGEEQGRYSPRAMREEGSDVQARTQAARP